MPDKQIYVVALAEGTYAGSARVPGELFQLGIVDSIVLERKKHVRFVSKAFVAAHLEGLKSRRRGTYQRRDLVAKHS